MESINLIYVRFDKNLDYRTIVRSKSLKKFCMDVYGYETKFVSPSRFKFDIDKLGEFIQKEYESSWEYMYPSSHTISMKYPTPDTYSYLPIFEFEPNVLIDDNLIAITYDDKVLGVIATESDFEKIIGEL